MMMHIDKTNLSHAMQDIQELSMMKINNQVDEQTRLEMMKDLYRLQYYILETIKLKKEMGMYEDYEKEVHTISKMPQMNI